MESSFKGKKRQTNEVEFIERGPKNPRIEIINVENYNPTMVMDNCNSSYLYYNYNGMIPNTQYQNTQYFPYFPQEMSNNQYFTQEMYSAYYSQDSIQYNFQETNPASIVYTTSSQEDNELNRSLCKDVDKVQVTDFGEKTVELCDSSLTIARTVIDGASSVAKNFSIFAPFINSFLDIGKEIITLYEKAEHNKELCGFLLKRCNFAMCEVQDLIIRKTEHADFFSKQENLTMFIGFIECMKKIKKFIADVSQLNKLKKFLYANNIEENCTKLETEFEGYMSSLNFSFAMRTRNEFATQKYDMRQIKDLLFNVYGVSDDKQTQQKYFKGMDVVNEGNKKFQIQMRQNKLLESTTLEESEPLLNGNHYQKTEIFPSKRIGKRTSFDNCDDYCFKEFSNNLFPLRQQTQFEIRRQVNILKELKNSDHIIRFFGVAQENSKYYLVTEWMEFGNLHEYYTNFRDNMNWKTKIKFALDICRGVAYLHGCKILHHDIQSANILVNENRKVKITNFGLSKKFSEVTKNITYNLENIRYMAPEQLLLDNDENNDARKKKVPYDSKCEIYSVGALLWEIVELKKPHSDLNSELLVNIRKRVMENYVLPFANDVPYEWRLIVSRAMENEPDQRVKISDICLELYKLNKKYSNQNVSSPMPPPSTITITSVENAVYEPQIEISD